MIVTEPVRLRVLLVDDEPAVLEGLELQLGRRYEVHVATSGQAALNTMATMAPFAIVMSDMRMPGMDGAQFLKEARARQPDSVRLLLTGYADVPSAIAAVNDGALFRFLTKPCPPTELLASFEAAATQYRLQQVEHELLESTLRGAIKALAEILGVVDPAGHGEALRVQRLVHELSRELQIDGGWPLEVAALLSSIGAVSLPAGLLQRFHAGEPLADDEAVMIDGLPALTDRLLSTIPRLEPARAILLLRHGKLLPDDWNALFDAAAIERLTHSARILELTSSYDSLQVRGYGEAEAIGMLRDDDRHFAEPMVAALERLVVHDSGRIAIRQLPVLLLRPGMVIAGELRSSAGQLLVGKGFVVTESFLAKLWNIPRGRVREPVPVLVPTRQDDHKAA